MQIFVKLQGGRTRSLCFNDSHVSVASLKEQIADYEGIPSFEQRLVCAQRELADDSILSGDDLFFLSLSLRVFGGKGGFGSLLRGAGSKIGQKKTDNFDACRDLSGRRLRHANNEKKIAEWVASEKERDMEKVALQHIKRLANQHTFDDKKYTAEGDDIKESMSSALERGIDEAKKSGVLSSKKRGYEETDSVPEKRRQAWTDDDDLFGGESETEETTKEKNSKKSKKSKKDEDNSLTTSSSSKNNTHNNNNDITTTTTTISTTSISTSTTPEKAIIEKTTTSTTSSTIIITSNNNNNNNTNKENEIEKEIDLKKYGTAKELEQDVGGERLKTELQRLGLLCGGTPADRAARLFLLKTTPLEKLDKKHLQRKKK